MHVCMMGGWFILLSRQRLQICSNGGTTTVTSGPVKCEAKLHGCRTSPVFIVYILAISKVTQDGYRLLTVHTYGDFIALPQSTSTIPCYPNQSHYPDTEPTCHCFILIMPRARLGSEQVSI